MTTLELSIFYRIFFILAGNKDIPELSEMPIPAYIYACFWFCTPKIPFRGFLSTQVFFSGDSSRLEIEVGVSLLRSQTIRALH